MRANEPDFEQIAADRDEQRGPTAEQVEDRWINWAAGEQR